MFGPGITKVFTSRWKALWWSAGILMTAYCSVPSADETAQQSDPASAADAKAAQEAIATLDRVNSHPDDQ
jgi:hypothetical protein